MIVEMHEDVHGSQNLTELQYDSKIPRLEIEAYAGSYANYVAIQGAPPPAPNLSMDDWNDYLGDDRSLRRQNWDDAVAIYDPLEATVIDEGINSLTGSEKTKYYKNRNILESMWSDFFNTEVDKLNAAAYDKDTETNLSCD